MEIVRLRDRELGCLQVDFGLVKVSVLPGQIADTQRVAGLWDAHSTSVARIHHSDVGWLSLFPWCHYGEVFSREPDDVFNLFIGWYFQREDDRLLKDCNHFLRVLLISRKPFG